MQSSWKVEVDLREPWFFYRATSSSKQEEAASFTKIGPSDTHRSSRCRHSELCSSYRQVAQGQLHTTSYTNLYLNPNRVDSEPTETVVDFRPHWSWAQLATQPVHSKWDFCRHQIMLGTMLPQVSAHVVSHIRLSKFTLTVSQPEELTQPMKGPTAFKTQPQQWGAHNSQGTLLEHGPQVT